MIMRSQKSVKLGRDSKTAQKTDRQRHQVNIAAFKVRMGQFLKQVRAGEEVILMDRQMPVAKVVPFRVEQEKPQLTIREATRSLQDVFAEFGGLRQDGTTDSLAALLEERGER